MNIKIKKQNIKEFRKSTLEINEFLSDLISKSGFKKEDFENILINDVIDICINELKRKGYKIT